MECVKVTASFRKSKKKPVKDELDRIKQAEKKKKRLEKALATSAAIRSELEKKKLKKKEEQERLDEEGASIAEAVALQVLLGEDTDNSKKDGEGLSPWDHTSNVGFITGSKQPHLYDLLKNPCELAGIISDPNQYGRWWNFWGHSNAVGPTIDMNRGFFYPENFVDVWGTVGLSAGHIAAQAVSPLKISEDSRFVANRYVQG